MTSLRLVNCSSISSVLRRLKEASRCREHDMEMFHSAASATWVSHSELLDGTSSINRYWSY